MAAIKQTPSRVNELTRSAERIYLDLNGEWSFRLDPDGAGSAEGIFSGAWALDDTIAVPGCLEAQGKGLVHGPLRQPAWFGGSDIPYLGVSWHLRRFEAPKTGDGKRLFLNFGGVSTDCQVWLNGKTLCEHHYGAVPFGIEVTGLLREGENTLLVQVENNHTYEERTPSGTHGFGSSTLEMRWSGIYRAVELVATAKTRVEDVCVIPDAKAMTATVSYALDGEVDGLSLSVRITGADGAVYTAGAPASPSGKIRVDMRGAKLWSDSEPNLYDCTVALLRGPDAVDSLTERFGLRDVAYDGRHILLNGKPVYLRGEMTHFHWPGSISPCTDREDLREKLAVYKRYGMNFMRHHTFFPHPEYMEICDELGLLCHNELGVASNSWAIDEGHGPAMWQALIKTARNRPSVIVWCMGNEIIHDSKEEDLPDEATMKLYKELTFSLDQTRLLQDNSPGFYHFPDGRPKQLAPIHHEIRRSGASYIDPAAKRHYTGALRPWRMLWAEEKTAEAGIGYLLPRFVRNTQLLQGITRKYVLEETRLNAEASEDGYYRVKQEFQGFELCTFRDSGSFVWGTVDDFFAPKAVSAEEFRKYNGETVLLWEYRWFDRLFQTGKKEDFAPITLRLSHFGPRPVTGGELRWRVKDEAGTVLAEETIADVSVEQGEVARICERRWYLPEVMEAARFTLEASLAWEGGAVANDWSFWCFPSPGSKLREPAVPYADHMLDWTLRTRLRAEYPFITSAKVELPAEAVLIAGAVDETLLRHLDRGGRALLIGRSCFPGEVTEWGAARSEYARGTILADHPLANRIPHDGFCDVPYHGMISGKHVLSGTRRNDLGMAIGLRGWPEELVPIIAGIPSYKNPEPQLLAHLFEVRVGKGRLLITSLDFGSYPAQNPATAYFFDQVLRYLGSGGFNPQTEVTAEFLREASRDEAAEVRRVTF